MAESAQNFGTFLAASYIERVEIMQTFDIGDERH